MFVLGTMRDQTTVSLCVFFQKGKARSKSCCSARWSSGYSWLSAKLKETLSAMSEACMMLFDLSMDNRKGLHGGAALSCHCSGYWHIYCLGWQWRSHGKLVFTSAECMRVLKANISCCRVEHETKRQVISHLSPGISNFIAPKLNINPPQSRFLDEHNH